MEGRREWEKPGPVHMEGKLCEVSDESSEKCGDIMRFFLQWAREVPIMFNDVAHRFLHRVSKI